MNSYRTFIYIIFRNFQAGMRHFKVPIKLNVVILSFFAIIVLLPFYPNRVEAALSGLIPDRLALQPVTNVIEEVTEPVTNVVEVVTEPITNVVEEVAEPVTNVAEEVAEPVTNVAEEVTEPITNVVEEVAEPATNVVEEVTKPITDVVGNVLKPVTDVVKETTKPVKKIIEPVTDVVEQSSDQIADALKETSEPESDEKTEVLQPMQEVQTILDPAADALPASTKLQPSTSGTPIKAAISKENIEDSARKSEIVGSLKLLGNKERSKNDKDRPLPFQQSLPFETLMILPGQAYYSGFGNSSSGLSSGTAFAIIRDNQLLKDLRYNSQIYFKEFKRSDQWAQAPPVTPPRITSSQPHKSKSNF